MEYETIIFEVKDHVACITLNRPAESNSVNLTIAKELMEAAVRCNQDPEIRAVILTGAGKMFSAGGDLQFFYDSGDDLPTAMKKTTVYCNLAVSHFMRMNAPLITAVNGAAAGIGMSFAISGDIVLAAESSVFMAAYTAVGLSPDGSMTYVLPRVAGLTRAKELLLTNRKLRAREAMEWGLVSRVVPDDDLMKEAETLARKFAAGPTVSFGSVKKLLNMTFSETLESQMEHESGGITGMTRTADGHEGISAFLERRPPHFTKK